MKITPTPLADLIIIEPKIFPDERGYFFEAFQQQRFDELGLPPFVQDNTSRSKKNVLRGLHYQLPYSQGKLISVIHGEVWDVVVDIRRSSPTFGQWLGLALSDSNHRQLYIPAGFAHGFCVLSDYADIYYKCTDFYAPTAVKGIHWQDPTLNIPWPITQPILAEKDAAYPTFKEIGHEDLFA